MPRSFTTSARTYPQILLRLPDMLVTEWIAKQYKIMVHRTDHEKLANDKTRTGHSCFVDFAYLDTTTYVEVNFHSQHFFSIFLCISTPSMSKTVNMKQRVSRGDFLCPRRIFYYICYCLCRSKNRRSHGRRVVCFGYIHVLAEVRTSSKQQ